MLGAGFLLAFVPALLVLCFVLVCFGLFWWATVE